MHRVTITLDVYISDMDQYVDVLEQTGSATVAEVVTDALPAIDWAQLGLELTVVSNKKPSWPSLRRGSGGLFRSGASVNLRLHDRPGPYSNVFARERSLE